MRSGCVKGSDVTEGSPADRYYKTTRDSRTFSLIDVALTIWHAGLLCALAVTSLTDDSIRSEIVLGLVFLAWLAAAARVWWTPTRPFRGAFATIVVLSISAFFVAHWGIEYAFTMGAIAFLAGVFGLVVFWVYFFFVPRFNFLTAFVGLVALFPLLEFGVIASLVHFFY